MESVAIVIPIYKKNISEFELISLNRCKEVFEKTRIIFVYPAGLEISLYIKIIPSAEFKPLKDKYFSSIYSYSRLLCIPYFYKFFLNYKYVLIYQLDAFVLENKLSYWCEKGYDYIGAPWINAEWIAKLKPLDSLVYPVGNGGFSLRKVKTFYYSSILLLPISTFLWRRKWNEDFFWSSLAKRLIPGFKIPQVNEALDFAFEENPIECFKLNGNKLPFGCHAWEKYQPEFWKPIFNKIGYQIPIES